MPDLTLDVATRGWIGTRDRQEDALLSHTGRPGEAGVIVLSDGMGGHSDGDIAARTIVSEVLADLFMAACRPEALRRHAPQILRRALEGANDRLRAHAAAGAGQEGMGGTLVSAVIQGDGLRWLSVGDSPLYLLRGGRLQRLNADHSLAPAIDLMVQSGDLDPASARGHPQRSVLTSAITGAEIAKIDCPDAPLPLCPGDILLLASDGIATLDDGRIATLLRRARWRPAGAIADRLMRAVRAQRAPDQDNVTFAVVKLGPAPRPASAPRPGLLRQTTGALYRLRARGLRS